MKVDYTGPKLTKPSEGPEGQLGHPPFDTLEPFMSESTWKVRWEDTSRDHTETLHLRLLHPISMDVQSAPKNNLASSESPVLNHLTSP